MLTADRLREALDYDPSSGAFRWRESRSGIVGGAGSVAGAPDGQGYRQIGIDGRLYREHRLAWMWVTGSWPADDLDHINGDRSDNRIENIRPATRSQNNANGRRPKDNTSGHKGVSFDKKRQRWHAYVSKNYKRCHVGYFETLDEARLARAAAAERFYGEFARAA